MALSKENSNNDVSDQEIVFLPDESVLPDETNDNGITDQMFCSPEIDMFFLAFYHAIYNHDNYITDGEMVCSSENVIDMVPIVTEDGGYFNQGEDETIFNCARQQTVYHELLSLNVELPQPVEIMVSRSSSTQGFCNGRKAISENGFIIADSDIAEKAAAVDDCDAFFNCLEDEYKPNSDDKCSSDEVTNL
ncbi:hypothetical protein JTB14_015234 [Gonioctena quinquepunctata]|nr:hypothetical protein JTB14_015234 [Gonioctena quinquepunctata]